MKFFSVIYFAFVELAFVNAQFGFGGFPNRNNPQNRRPGGFNPPIPIPGAGGINAQLPGVGGVNAQLPGVGGINAQLPGGGGINPQLPGAGEFNPQLPGVSGINLQLPGAGINNGQGPSLDQIGNIATSIKDTAQKFLPLNQEELGFLLDYGKKFNLKFDTEEAQRLAFDNVQIVSKKVQQNNDLFSRGLRTFKLGLYKFSHLTDKLFQEKYLGLQPPTNNVRRRREILSKEECKDAPDSLDWFKLNRVAHVKDQKECGSCFIFSSTGAIESAIAIEYGITPYNMSIQHSLDCIKDPKTGKQNGCSGGRPEWVWKSAKESGGGVQQTKVDEYTGVPSKECDASAAPKFFSDVEFWERIYFKGSPEEIEEQIKCRLAKSGPFHVSMTVKKDEMGSFKSGIYKSVNGECSPEDKVNHGMLLVGYGEKLLEGDREPTKFWMIQNSWGDRWGEDGYLYVERGVNICNFATDAYYPVLKKKFPPIPTPSVCKEVGDISGSNQKYLKSLCLIEDENSYEDAQKFCLNNKMRLFRADTDESKEALLTFANKNWSDRDEFFPFISGISTNEDAPACTSITKSDDDEFEVDNETDCADRASFICEFYKET